MGRATAAVIANLLDRVARDDLKASAALAAWPEDGERDQLFDASWHDLSPFATDQDVRSRDSRYEAHQVSLLRTRARQIREKYNSSNLPSSE